MINILIVDDQKVVREILKTYFVNESDLEVVGTANGSREALEKITTLKPDVVFMDVEMPGGVSGLEMTRTISALYPEIKVIIITENYTEENGRTAAIAGARGYFSKTTAPEQLVAFVRTVFQRGQLVAQDASLSHSKQDNLPTDVIHYIRKSQEGLANNRTKEFFAEGTSQDEPLKTKPNLQKYLSIGVLLNSLVWILAFAYLKLIPPTYSSQWGVKILETDSGVEVVLPDGGKASPAAAGWTPPTGQDPRNDYVYVATSPDLVAEAAEAVHMTVDEYREPTIDVDEENGIIAFHIEGDTPQEAQEKAIAFHRTMTRQIQELRRTELSRQESETQTTLTQAKAKLVKTQQKLSQYRATSGISTDEQITNLTDNIENLRRQKAELAAQQKGLGNRYTHLSQDVRNLGSPNAGDAYKLAADTLYQQHQNRYAELQGSLVTSLDRFTPDHPVVQEKKVELNSAANALRKRAAQILGRSVSIQSLTQLAPLTLDPQSILARESLQQDLVNNRAEWQRLKAQNKELSVQINSLEARLRNMSQNQFEVDSLQRDLQVAETVFAATLAKLDLGKDNIYSIYPPIQLVTQPNLPEKPSNPNPGAVFMGGLASSFLITTGLVLLWFDKKKFSGSSSLTKQSFVNSVTI